MTSEGYAQIYQAVLVRTGLPHGKVYEAVEAVHEELFGHGCKDTPEAAKHCYLRHHPTRQHKA